MSRVNRVCWLTMMLLIAPPGLQTVHSATEEQAVITREILAGLSFPADAEVDFTQRQLNPLLKRVNTQRGVLLKTARNELVMRVTEPRFEERILHDGTLTLRRKSRRHNAQDLVARRMQIDATRPSHLVLLALEALLNHRLDLIDAHFKLQASAADASAEAAWQLTLTPNTARMQQQISALFFYGRQQQLTGFRSERRNAQGRLTHWLEVTIQPPA